MRDWLLICVLGLTACLSPALAAALQPSFEIQVLDASVWDPAADAVTSGSLDSHFKPFDFRETRRRGEVFWLKLRSVDDFQPDAVPTVAVRKGRHLQVQMFATQAGEGVPLRLATELPGFRGVHDAVFVLADGLKAGQTLYARVEGLGKGSEELHFATAALDQKLAGGAAHARMIALTFGALMAMALASLLI